MRLETRLGDLGEGVSYALVETPEVTVLILNSNPRADEVDEGEGAD